MFIGAYKSYVVFNNINTHNAPPIIPLNLASVSISFLSLICIFLALIFECIRYKKLLKKSNKSNTAKKLQFNRNLFFYLACLTFIFSVSYSFIKNDDFLTSGGNIAPFVIIDYYSSLYFESSLFYLLTLTLSFIAILLHFVYVFNKCKIKIYGKTKSIFILFSLFIFLSFTASIFLFVIYTNNSIISQNNEPEMSTVETYNTNDFSEEDRSSIQEIEEVEEVEEVETIEVEETNENDLY